MREFITDFAKQELRIMVDEMTKDGATLLFISNKTGVSRHKLKRLMGGGACQFNGDDFSSIVKFYAATNINRKN